MRRLFFFLLAACLLTACMPDVEQRTPLEESLEGSPVLVSFSVPEVHGAVSTKSSGDEGKIGEEPYLDPDKFYLVVCGHSQSIKYIRKARLVSTETDYPVSEIDRLGTQPYPLAPEASVDKVTLYHFQAQLELSDSDRTIHFLGNIDENQLTTGSHAHEVLPSLLSEPGKQAYWQSVHLSHIIPKRDEQYNAVMQDGFFVLDEGLADSLSFVPLIRNFAKIRLVNMADKFELHSYAVIHQPTRGSVVPYRYNAGADARFVFYSADHYQFGGYEKCSFSDLEAMEYAGNLPAGVQLDDFIPTIPMFQNPAGSDGRVILYDETDEDQGFYIYERGVPTTTMNPTYVLIRGRMIDEDHTVEDPEHQDEDGYYYYRLDLMETATTADNKTISKYYPLYRNFEYEIELHRIASAGVATPEAAANASGAEDISADISMRHLPDISNGNTRLVVEPYMMQTFTAALPEGEYHELYVRFFDDVESATPNMDRGTVRVELEPTEGGGDDILILYDDDGYPVAENGFFYPVAQTVGDVEGIRLVRFNTVSPDNLSSTKTQKIKITGKLLEAHPTERLYREVEISLQKKQTMEITCDPANPYPGKDVPIQIGITIPAGLPESMFPLEFILEAKDMTLTPDNTQPGNNLPVQAGKSLSGNGKSTFQFIRTLTLDEYNRSISGNECTFYSYFRTNRRESATTIFVSNKFFTQAVAMLGNKEIPSGQFYVECREGETNCVVQLNHTGLYYRMDDGEWQEYRQNSQITVEPLHKVYFRGTQTGWNGGRFKCTGGDFNVGGNIASLMVGDDFEELGKFITSYSFGDFFKNHTNLISASALILPMEKCAEVCFKSMFDGCTRLVDAPALPATTMAKQCYRNMFYNCMNLETAPVLPATTVVNGCYQRMFYGCKKISEIRMYSSKYLENVFISDGNTLWAQGVASGGTIYLNPAIKGKNGTSTDYLSLIPKGLDGNRWNVEWQQQ